MAVEAGVLEQEQRVRETEVVAIDATKLGHFTTSSTTDLPLEDWNIVLDFHSEDAQEVILAAQNLQTSDTPIAFPTETVYGLGADATRSAAVKGIYRAKQRPSDNPLIVHIASITQLRDVLSQDDGQRRNEADVIPEIYKPLIRRFWPGPLTIILPNPTNSRLAPEVTAGLATFGARMPRNLLALVLIKLANVPVAAPSANASTKPSPTAAEHVLYDLQGRIETILDGGPCDVGVESTVVDGLSSPPAILRPGGISLSQIRACPGWAETVVGYKDSSEKDSKPKAPGMKYRHYSPKAKVVLFEAGSEVPKPQAIVTQLGSRRRIGIVRTRKWTKMTQEGIVSAGDQSNGDRSGPADRLHEIEPREQQHANAIQQMLAELSSYQQIQPEKIDVAGGVNGEEAFEAWDMRIGPSITDIARGLFSALRDLDRLDVDAILVEGIRDGDEGEDGIAAAVMNRLRKAAEIHVS